MQQRPINETFWTAEEQARRAPIERSLREARAAYKRLFDGAYGSPNHPFLTALIDQRRAEGKGDFA